MLSGKKKISEGYIEYGRTYKKSEKQKSKQYVI